MMPLIVLAVRTFVLVLRGLVTHEAEEGNVSCFDVGIVSCFRDCCPKEKGHVPTPSYTHNPSSTAVPQALAGHLDDFVHGCVYAPGLAARKLTRLLRRVPVKSVCMAPTSSQYDGSESRSPVD